MEDKTYKPIFAIHILSCLFMLIVVCLRASRNSEDFILNVPRFLGLLTLGILSYSVAWYLLRWKNKRLHSFIYLNTCLLGTVIFLFCSFITFVAVGYYLEPNYQPFENLYYRFRRFLLITSVFTIIVFSMSYSLQIVNRKLDSYFTKIN